jgi:DNA (cytosine-5)-methyltransferase 3A
MPITARGYAAWNTQFVTDECGVRDLTLNEYKSLQTIPADYKMDVIKSKATDLIGDGWTVDVVAHIFRGMNLPTK